MEGRKLLFQVRIIFIYKSGPLAPENPDADEVQKIKQGDRDMIMMNRPMQTRILGDVLRI